MLYYFKRERKTPSFLGVHNSLPSHKESVKATAGIALIVQGERREGRERRERGVREEREERERRERRERNVFLPPLQFTNGGHYGQLPALEKGISNL